VADPADYSKRLLIRGFATFGNLIYDAAATLHADGTPVQAQMLRRAFDDYMDELNRIATVVAQSAESYIKEEEEVSRVRPDTGGAGGPRLGDYIGESHSLGRMIPGSVGVNFKPVLEANVPWWWTNEEGYGGHIGREIRGYFQPGSASPSMSQFREHPTFRPGGKGKGIIQNPIPERRFVERGFERVVPEWNALCEAAKRRFMAEVARITALADQERKRQAARKQRQRGRRRT
jgi:hypothetical protein